MFFDDHDHDHCHHHHDEGGFFSNLFAGCFGYLTLIILAIAIIFGGILVGLSLFSYIWIPGIIGTIYFIVSKDTDGLKKKKITAAAVICGVSLVLFLIGMLRDDTSDTPEVRRIETDWETTRFDISETTEVAIKISPEDAELESLELEENDIAELTYENGKAIISFKDTGSDYLYFIANGDVRSTGTYIIVRDQGLKNNTDGQEPAQEAAPSPDQEPAAGTEDGTAPQPTDVPAADSGQVNM